MNIRLITVFLIVLLCSFTFRNREDRFITTRKAPDIYHTGWIDLNKNGVKDIYEDSSQPVEARINDLLSKMTLDEKTCQMATLYGYGRVLKDELPNESWKTAIWKDGIGSIDEHLNGLAYHENAKTEFSWPPSKHARAINEVQRFFIEDTRLGIPVDFTNEGIRGLCHQGATCFPSQMGVGGTWDTDLAGQIGRITGREAKVLGYTNVYSPILDLARDPRWGRTVEGFSEDPYLTGKLGLEMVRSIQHEGVASTAKHFAVYSAPAGGRDGDARTDPHVTPREVHELYLEPFRKAVMEGGLMGIMSSYNDYNGIPITASHYFLTELLRQDWGFQGYIVSDSWAVGGLEGRHHVAENMKESVYQAVMAGLNMRTNFTPPGDFILPLRELVEENRIPMEIIDARVSDILRVKFKLGLFDAPYVNNPEKADLVVHCDESQEISLRASRESIVLLRNSDSLLPVDLTQTKYKSILITGPNAKAINHSISRYGPSEIPVISLFDGIKSLVGSRANILYAPGCDFYDENWPRNELYEIPPSAQQQKLIQEAVMKVAEADLIIVAVGDNEHTVGESNSRTSLDLPGNQRQLIQALYATGKPIIVVLINGRPLSINWIDDHIGSVIEGWFPGEYGGTALAEVIFGVYNPGGKLPVTFPRTVGQIPMNFPARLSSQNGQGEGDFGRTRVNTPLYPFGYGLSYTSFNYSNLRIKPDTSGTEFDSIIVEFEIQNTGKIAGDEVVQLYIQDKLASVVGYEKLLRGFKRIHLMPSEIKTVRFCLLPEDLSLLDKNMNKILEPGEFDIQVGSSSADIQLRSSIQIN